MGISQQSASKFILNLIDAGFITRIMEGKFQIIEISENGRDLLFEEFSSLSSLLGVKDSIRIRGTVQSGMGEGRYYVSRKPYVIQFKEKLGFIPYMGTLNMKVDPTEEISLRRVRGNAGIKIDGFVTDDRSFGPVKVFKGFIEEIQCAIIFPERSVYRDVIEVISEDYLRDKLKLSDGSKVQLRIEVSD
ncbi:Riboflavin kinase, CTP-dependent, archaeal domain protein [mine drainage metagenome]|uniref:Riboflavin kinase n=1 Tax=mine drainage metagenome TaxID=410659 RepID=T0ZIN3_9ZZZZ